MKAKSLALWLLLGAGTARAEPPPADPSPAKPEEQAPEPEATPDATEDERRRQALLGQIPRLDELAPGLSRDHADVALQPTESSYPTARELLETFRELPPLQPPAPEPGPAPEPNAPGDSDAPDPAPNTGH